MRNKGFTLIELLVVIAIIGILASVVLASVTSTRNRAKDRAIQENLNSARSQAELYYNENGNYGAAGAGTGVCALMGALVSGYQITEAINQSAKPANRDQLSEVCFVATGGVDWAAAVQMNEPATPTYYCVDSTGAGKAVPEPYPIDSTDVTC